MYKNDKINNFDKMLSQYELLSEIIENNLSKSQLRDKRDYFENELHKAKHLSK